MQTYRHALVFGLGESGEWAARLLRSEGAVVRVMDQSDNPTLRERAARLHAEGITVDLGAQRLPADVFDVAVTSPGLSPDNPLLAEARSRGLALLPEFELGWMRHQGRTLALTGTNGKSTMVKWLAESLVHAGFKAVPAGNYGLPVTRAVREAPGLDWLVLELSSFQLEQAVAFRPDTGVLLNLAPNHLDRHPDFDHYARAKARIFTRMGQADRAVVHEAHAAMMRQMSGGAGQWCTFGESPVADYTYRDGAIVSRGRPVADLRGTYFDNEILGVNAAGAVAALRESGVDSKHAVAAARVFTPLRHRMEPVGEIKGVRFINDSKATTLGALVAGLKMCPGKVRLIAGGLLKESGLEQVKKVLAERASGVYLIGKASDLMASAWSGAVPCHPCGNLEDALRAAWRDAVPGETVLLSPACASFDQFRNFEQRGDVFRCLVDNLAGEER